MKNGWSEMSQNESDVPVACRHVLASHRSQVDLFLSLKFHNHFDFILEANPEIYDPVFRHGKNRLLLSISRPKDHTMCLAGMACCVCMYVECVAYYS